MKYLFSIIISVFVSSFNLQAQFDELHLNDFGLEKDVYRLIEKHAGSPNAAAAAAKSGSREQLDSRPYEEYFFDQKGFIEKVHFFEHDTLVGIGEYSFSESGELIRIMAKNPDGSEVGPFVDNTIEDGRMTIKAQAMTGRKTVYSFNEKERKIKEEEFYNNR